MQGYPHITSITAAGDCCTLQLDDACTIELDLSLPNLQSYMRQNEFPSIGELINDKLIQAIPLPLRMRESEWSAISSLLQRSDHFRTVTMRFPKLLTDIYLTYAELQQLPHHLYGGVGMYLDGKGLATLYTSHPIDFQPDEQKGKNWYFKLLVTGDNHLVWTHVNLQSSTVETSIDHRPWHFVTNSSAS